MGAGGATWDTAGTLDLGSGNTFDFADATEDVPGGSGIPYNHAWWTYTPSGREELTIDTFGSTNDGIDTILVLYTGDSLAGRVFEDSSDDFPGHGTFSRFTSRLLPGVTYHILVGTFATTDANAVTYQLNVTRVAAVSTSWLDDLRERDDNQLVIGSDWLVEEENIWTEFQEPQDFNDLAAYGEADQRPRGRKGEHVIQSVLSGTSLLDGADECAWAHAVNGDTRNGPTFWNPSPNTDPDDHGTPTCRTIGEGAVNNDLISQMKWELQYDPPVGLFAGTMTAEVNLRAWGTAFRFVWNAMTERGALPASLITDALTAGVPAAYADTAEQEWDGDLELISVEITGDDWGEDVDTADAATFVVNDSILPTYAGGGTYNSWSKGTLGAADLMFTHEDGVDWHTLTAFDNPADFVEDGPDIVVGAGISIAFDSSLPAAWDDDHVIRFNVSTPGYRFTFRSPRYRWVWYPAYASPIASGIPPRRIFPRNDGATQGARRVLGGGNTRQAGSRTLGSIL